MDIKSFWPELGPSLEEASVYLNKYKNKKNSSKIRWASNV